MANPAVTNNPKEKIETIMEAANALTALGDEESTSEAPGSPLHTLSGRPSEVASKLSPNLAKEASPRRYIPEHKKQDAALTFPEKMMNLMKYAEEQKKDDFCVGWLPDGKSFVIRNPDEFTRLVLPKFFKATKFSSFTRKLYRWGFRQVNRGIGPDDPIIFGNEHFQRDNAEEMSKMRSITAASSRKADAQTIYGAKRSIEEPDTSGQKRALLESLIQQKTAAFGGYNPGIYAGLGAPGGAVSLTNALRPNLGLGLTHSTHFNGGLPAAMSKHMGLLQQQNYQRQFQQQHQPQPIKGALRVDGGMNGNIMGSYVPQYPMTPNQGSQSGNTASSTADIVSAAISALRYAS